MPLVTERDREEIRKAAEAGDETAKAALAALPKEPAPEPEKAEPVKDVKVGTVEEKPEEKTPEEKPQVDQTQEKPEPRERERKHPAALRIDREKREMRRMLDTQQKQIEALLKKFEEASPRKPEEPEADELNKLLANPRQYLAERDKNLLESFQKRSSAEQQRLAQEMARKHVERENALKTISSIEGYDDERDSDQLLQLTAEYLNDVYDTNRYDAEEVEQLWVESPGSLAPVMRKAWKKARALDEKAKSDKKAASAAPSEAGKSGGRGAPSIGSLNQQLAQANEKGDRKLANEIVGKIAELLGEK